MIAFVYDGGGNGPIPRKTSTRMKTDFPGSRRDLSGQPANSGARPHQQDEMKHIPNDIVYRLPAQVCGERRFVYQFLALVGYGKTRVAAPGGLQAGPAIVR